MHWSNLHFGPMPLAELIEELVGRDVPVAFEAYDGSRLGPADTPATIVIRSPNALQRLVSAPGELGFGRAYVAGDIDVEGDIYAALGLQSRLPELRVRPQQWLAILRLVGTAGLRPLPPPPEEARLRGRRHS